MQFKDLKIIEPILKALRKQNYIEPTSIQVKAIPLILKRNDVLGSAQTGTGKTAAFAIPILQHLYLDSQRNKKSRKILSLIITPTRELAIQIGDSFSKSHIRESKRLYDSSPYCSYIKEAGR